MTLSGPLQCICALSEGSALTLEEHVLLATEKGESTEWYQNGPIYSAEFAALAAADVPNSEIHRWTT